MRLLYLQPVQGVLTVYESQEKFPQKPIKNFDLDKTSAVEIMHDSKWYFHKGFTYMRLEIDDSDHIFCSESKEELELWIQ